MKLQDVLLKTIITVSWFSMPFAIIAQSATLSLKHGLYVQSSMPCKDAPFAAMKSWDGIGFAGPHSSKCRSRVVTHHGNQYKVTTACSALGDGSPNPSGTADEETVQLERLSNQSFALWNAAKPKSTYRWCSAK